VITMNSLGKQTLAGLRILVVLTVLLGVVYPLGVWLVSRLPGLADHAEGSPVVVRGQTVGSALIGIDPVAGDPGNDPYFHTRPSAIAAAENGLGPADASTSGASNQGGSSAGLTAVVKARKEIIAEREGVSESRVPADAVTASASGLDPDISPAYADLQVARVARVNGLPEHEVRQLVGENTSSGIGDAGVNVLTLNLAVRAATR
jgi:K+-transporting ATPase ATPase C chain